MSVDPFLPTVGTHDAVLTLVAAARNFTKFPGLTKGDIGFAKNPIAIIFLRPTEMIFVAFRALTKNEIGDRGYWVLCKSL